MVVIMSMPSRLSLSLSSAFSSLASSAQITDICMPAMIWSPIVLVSSFDSAISGS